MLINFTQDQFNALEEFRTFMNNKDEDFFIIQGYAGTGKSHLLKALILEVSKHYRDYNIYVTATTHKAVAVLAEDYEEACTIHSLLGLTVLTDFKTGETKLKQKSPLQNYPTSGCIFIDEASFIDPYLLKYIKESIHTGNKIVFLGDPAQLAPIKSKTIPAFDLNVRKYILTEVVRQDKSNPINKLCEDLRETIKGADFPKVNTDDKHIIYLKRDDFDKEVINEFNKDWKPTDSRVLAWTNKTVEKYNKLILNKSFNRDTYQAGDYLINNTFMSGIPTDTIVRILSIEPSDEYNTTGSSISLDNAKNVFLPEDVSLINKEAKKAINDGDVDKYRYIKNFWIDLRLPYASTVNKSQGSTFNKVYIDLDDISKCKNPDTLARLLYVAVSRAKHQVIFTGDIV